MKKYRLLKDLLVFKKGTIFNSGHVKLEIGDTGQSGNIKCYPDWFEEIKEECYPVKFKPIVTTRSMSCVIACDGINRHPNCQPKQLPSQWIKEWRIENGKMIDFGRWGCGKTNASFQEGILAFLDEHFSK